MQHLLAQSTNNVFDEMGNENIYGTLNYNQFWVTVMCPMLSG